MGTRPAIVLAILLNATLVGATPVIIQGADPGATFGAAHPSSLAAEAAFIGAASPNTLIGFETAPIGAFASLVVAPGVTATFSGGQDNTFSGIRNDNTPANNNIGFDTTPGGANYVRFAQPFNNAGGDLTFQFAAPISSFGFYLTGTETTPDGNLSLVFNDGSLQSLAISRLSTVGTQFFGVIDTGASISSITLHQVAVGSTRDLFGLDDVRFSAAATVPEPTSLLLLGVGIAGMAVSRRQRFLRRHRV